MNILITGANGFLAKEILVFFSDKKYNLFPTNRKTLNILDDDKVANFIEKNKIDIVLHTAVSGCGKKTDTYEDFCNNIMMFRNLHRNRHMFKMMINFGSGAEFDRRQDIKEKKEATIFDRFPDDYYGLAKNLITREILKSENIYNFRLFGCFGKHENETRFISNSINRCLQSAPIFIEQNRLMDFVYVEDLCKLVEHYLNNFTDKELYKDVNVCYNEKYDLKGISKKILLCLGLSTNNIQYKKPGLFRTYTGDGSQFGTFNLDLTGLDEGIQKIINEKQ